MTWLPVSPSGRLISTTLYLEGLTLAHLYAVYVDRIFLERHYTDLYPLRVATITMVASATKMPARCSVALRDLLVLLAAPTAVFRLRYYLVP
ncbi:hypothetical protein CU664_08600 [Pseudomonas syringae pv. actinidifoliorum]|nr:hypothetical protein [Pseudomonas syringae pv. actinidifoliorum]NAT63345.1 hypothetical protein [Pseudomonas syringae pv. actinidifoliorum]